MKKVKKNKMIELSSELGKILTDRRLTVSTAESCTGGLLSHILTGVSGSSGYFTGGVIAYSNRIKEQVLGVTPNTLLKYGAVSEQTAREMAEGIRKNFETSIGLSTTGIAGPTGGTPEKPVGLVWVGIGMDDTTQTLECRFKGKRAAVKTQTVKEILTQLLNLLGSAE